MDGIAERTFVVTGAASGIGRATAQRLLAAGGRVALLDRDRAGLDEVVAVAVGAGGAAGTGGTARVVAFGCDVTDADAVEEAVAGAAEHLGPLHGVVTCAGIFDPADLCDVEAVDLDVFAGVLDVNLMGTVHVLRAALGRMGPGGAVVTVASTAGLRGHGFGPAYTASKGAVVALTRLVAVQYGPRGIRANCVCPGATAGEGMGSVFLDPEVAAGTARGLPLARVGAADDLGATIAALLSDECRYVTGQVLAVDGGATVR